MQNCDKCNAVDRSYADQFEDTSHTECDDCHIVLCKDCDEGDFLYSEKIDAGLQFDQYTEKDFTYLCGECLEKRNIT